MPTPKKGESQKDFVKRCVPIVLKEKGTKDQKHAVGKCHGMWRQAQKKKRDLTLNELSSVVSGAWEAQYGNEAPYSWAQYVFEDYIVIRLSGKYVRIDYSIDKDGVAFDLEGAQEVEHEFVPVNRRLIGSPIRAAEGKGQEGLYQCYGMLFGSSSQRDTYGTWFDAKTNYHLDWYNELPWLYHHTRNPFIGSRKIGTWVEKGIDDTGVFVLGELALRQEYLKQIQLLLKEGLLFPSSGTLSYAASPPDENGYICDWPIVEVSSTVAPADVRQGPISSEAVRAIEQLRR